MEIKLNENDFIFSKTDLKGRITYCNNEFEKYSEYTRKELIGKPHNILRHKDMPKIAFKILWDKIKNKEDFYGFVKNKTKNNNFYWVFTYVAIDKDKNNNIIGYSSIRRKANEDAIHMIEKIYKKLNNNKSYLKELESEYGMGYNELIISLQEGLIK